MTFLDLGEQRDAIRHGNGPQLIVAGAGSGKTTVMAERVVHLITELGWRADQILGLTFSNKAAANLRQRTTAVVGAGSELTITTYHGFGASIVGDHAIELGLRDRPLLLDRARAWQLLYGTLDSLQILHRKTGHPPSLIRDALTFSSTCADHLVTIETVRADCERLLAIVGASPEVHRAARGRLDLCTLVEAYERAKHDQCCIDFGDQIRLAVQLVEGDPRLAAELRERHPVVLLDEYQDTNYAQRHLLELIYRDEPNITAVGDDMQSIYGFRGAHIENILRFEEHFDGVTLRRLETNHRSGDQIVQLANTVQAEVPEARPKELRARPDAALATIERFVAADGESEAHHIAARCAAIGPPFGEIAVLCRKRKLMPAIADALGARGIPAEVVGLGGLLTRPEVVDVVAWLEILGAADPSVAVLRILKGPRYRIGVRDLAALARHARRMAAIRREATEGLAAGFGEGPPVATGPSRGRIDLVGTIDDVEQIADLSAEAWTRLQAFIVERDGLRATSARVRPVALVEAVIFRTGLWEAVDAVGLENLLRFVDLVESFVPLPSEDDVPSLQALLEYFELIAESEDDIAEATPTDADSVKVMTIHQSKGLEFDTVFVAGLTGAQSRTTSIFPDERLAENGMTQMVALPPWLRADGDPSIAVPMNARDLKRSRDAATAARHSEELRLLYVAVTRARLRLVLSAAHWYAGPATPQGPSEFYDLLGRQDGLVPERFREPAATVNPAAAARERRGAAAREAVAAAPATAAVAAPLRTTAVKPSGRTGRRSLSPDQGSLLGATAGTGPGAALGRPVPVALSATSIVTYARCPRQFQWTVVRPLPRRPSAAANLGTAIHRWIEDLGSRQPPRLAIVDDDGLGDAQFEDTSFDDPAFEDPAFEDPAFEDPTFEDPAFDDPAFDDPAFDDPAFDDPGPRGGGPTNAVEALKDAFRSSPYASQVPTRTEVPFAIAIGGHVLRGRVDAVYTVGGVTDVVDFKTGRTPASGDGSAGVQLDLYGLVAVRNWGVDPDRLRTTYCYLARDSQFSLVQTAWTASRVAEVEARLLAEITAIDARRFEPTPGSWCRGCDFRALCEPGQRTIAQLDAG